MVSMARPFLADPEFLVKAAAGTPEAINTCIACNQACLDHTFSGLITSCLVNPRACHETLLTIAPAMQRRSVAVVGAGPAGLAAATTAAPRAPGHPLRGRRDARRAVQLRQADPRQGGVPRDLRYFAHELEAAGVETRFGHRVSAAELVAGAFDDVLLATGVLPRVPEVAGVDHPSVVTYLDVLRHHVPVGPRVAVMGAGGIGFDIAEYLTQTGPSGAADPAVFNAEWGIDPTFATRGGVIAPPRSTRPGRSTSSSARPPRSGRASGGPPAGSTAPSSRSGA